MLEHLRNLERAKQVVRAGDYSADWFATSEIKGKKFGIIGLGRIGQRVAELALAFGARVHYWSKNRKKAFEAKGLVYEPLDTLIATSDFLSLHVSKTPDTEKILSSKYLQALKAGTIVVNVAPMELVDLPALVKRLQKGDITFIFDHPDEMDKKDVETLAKQEIFVANLKNFLSGSPTNQVS